MKNAIENEPVSESKTELSSEVIEENLSEKQQHKLKKQLKKQLKESKSRIRSFFSEFKKFINRGNIVDLAVAVIIGTAFTKIVNSLVNDIVMPLIGAMAGKTDMNDLKWIIRGSITLNWGTFLLTIIDFLIIAFFVFLVLRTLVNAEKGFTKLSKKQKKQLKANPQKAAEPPAVAAPVLTETELLKEILELLKSNSAFKQDISAAINETEAKTDTESDVKPA